MLARIAVACASWNEADLEQFLSQKEAKPGKRGTNRGRPSGKKGADPSEKAAQLMLLADAADATGDNDIAQP